MVKTLQKATVLDDANQEHVVEIKAFTSSLGLLQYRLKQDGVLVKTDESLALIFEAYNDLIERLST